MTALPEQRLHIPELSDAATAAKSRIPELDVLRGFAVLGIFWINIVYFGLPYDAFDMPLLFGHADRLNLFAWWLDSQFVEGSMFALFSMLFGASALVILDEAKTGGGHGVQVVERYYRRNLWLMVFGLFHAFVLLSPFEVLFSYGALGLVLFPLRRLRPWTLLLLGLLLTSVNIPDGDDPASEVGAALSQEESLLQLKHLFNGIPEDRRAGVIQAYRQSRLADMQGEIDLYRSDYATIFDFNAGSAVYQQTHNLYFDNFFDAGGMMLIGMALLKLGVITGGRSAMLYLAMMLVGYVIALGMRLPIVYEAIQAGFPPKVMLGLSEYRHFLARLPLAFGHIGLVLLLCRVARIAPLLKGLAAVGRMALSNYLMQSLFSVLFFYGFGLAMFAELERYQLALTALAFGGIQILYSLVWMRFFRYGPMEWLWRSLVRGRLEPMRLPKAPPVAAALPLPQVGEARVWEGE